MVVNYKINDKILKIMHEIIHFQTNTATVVIYDLVSLKHRVNDDADWWSFPEDEVVEINKGNVLFLNVGDMAPTKFILKMMLKNILVRCF